MNTAGMRFARDRHIPPTISQVVKGQPPTEELAHIHLLQGWMMMSTSLSVTDTNGAKAIFKRRKNQAGGNMLCIVSIDRKHTLAGVGTLAIDYQYLLDRTMPIAHLSQREQKVINYLRIHLYGEDRSADSDLATSV